MADGDQPIRPKPAVPPLVLGQPLPRIWKSEPEPEADEDQGRDRRSRRTREKEEKEQAEAEAKAETVREKERAKAKPKAKPKPKAGGKGDPSGKKGVLLEATPELDTYESRQRVRLIIGGVVGLVALTGLILGLQTLGGPRVEPEPLPDEGAIASDATGEGQAPGAGKPDIEAKNLLATAKQLAKNGKTDAAIVALNRLMKSHPNTPAAADAKSALDRPAANFPLFLDEPAIVATPTPGVAAKGDPSPEVHAVEPKGGVRPGATVDAQVDLPPNPAEPGRAPSPKSTASKTATTAKSLPAGFRADPDVGVHASGWPLQIVSDRDGTTMCLVPGGTFPLGRDDGTPDEGPEHRVKLGAFYVDQHEVTNRQYAIHLRETARRPAPRSSVKKDTPAPGEDLPMVNVSATEAKVYCEWAGKSLPTEAQWEAAARTTDGRLYPWGSSPPTWSRPRVPRQIDPVMSFELDQTPYATFDMAGNAWEWTRDWFDSKYYQSLKSTIAENPTGPATSRARPPQVVVKGGSKLWFLAWREGLKPDTKMPYVGFRGVLTVETSVTPSTASTGAPAVAPTISTVPQPNASGVVPF